MLLILHEISAYSVESSSSIDNDDDDRDDGGGGEKPFCRGSQCRKQFNVHSHQMKVLAGSKQSQKNKGKLSISV